MNRIKELDALRGIFALAVVFSHYTENYDIWYQHTHPVYKIALGSFGVCAFFVISGYVITMSLSQDRGNIHFVSSRISRLIPAYWASILATFTIIHLYPIRYRATNLWETLFNFTMLQNFFSIKEVDGVYWSLAVELTFYIFAAMTLKWHSSKYLKLYFILLLIFQHALQYLEPSNIIFTFFSIYIPYFILGMVFFKYENIKEITILFIFVLCGLNSYLYLSLVEYLFIFVIFVLFKYKYLSFLNTKPLIWLGSISYPLYLCHQNIGYVVISFLKNFQIHSYISIFIALLFTVFLSFLIKYLIEDKTKYIFYKKIHYVLSKVFHKPSKEELRKI